ncbi:hypothetical protein CSC73_08210 [Pseudoxanthomonas sacheonensis]|nr:hypothetical protein CSC73_08210 [Pseudoxanthomonas sacheonensis]
MRSRNGWRASAWTLRIGRVVVLALLLAHIGCAPTAEVDRSPSPAVAIVLEDVTLFDGESVAPRTGMSVVVSQGKIVQVARTQDVSILPGWRVQRLHGSFVLPGLFDTHAHVTFLREPNTFSGYDAATSERILKILLAHGITTILNPAAPEEPAVQLRDAIAAGQVLGPRMLTAGPPINWSEEKTPDQVRAEVNRQADAGVDYIKVYARMPPSLVRAATDAAHARGLRVVGHLQATSPEEAVAAGIDAITHGATWTTGLLPEERRNAYLKRQQQVGFMRSRIDWLNWIDLDSAQVQGSIQAVARSRTPLDPTLIAYVTKFRGRDPRYRNSPYLDVAPREVLATWDGWLDDWPDEEFARGAAAWPRMLELVKRYYDAGALLTTGSDFPNPYVIPGAGLHDEMELLVQAGIPPAEVIRIATRNGAESLRLLGETGTVAVGKRADLVVLGADPTADINNVRKIKIVFLGGREYSPVELLEQAGVGSLGH